MRKCLKILPAMVIGAVLLGCQTKAGTGAVVGGAGGAAVGAIIGHQSGHAGGGALIGGAVGALGGALVGNEMDKADEKKAREQQRTAEREYDRRNATASRDEWTQQDVIHWTARGTKDDVIIQRIETSGTVFRLTAADENELRDNGVSERVIRAMKATNRR